MSMFHELMMRKKEQIMYATIKGTLTESPDGVFSGFSSANYLLTQTEIQAESFKGNVRTKINSGTTGYNGVLNMLKSSHRFSIEYNGVNAFRFYAYNETTSSNQAKTLGISSLTDIWLDFYFEYDKTAKTLFVSVRNAETNQELGRVNYTDIDLLGGNIQYGYLFNAFNGSIDFNYSYIKLGSTKYKLQAVPEE